MSNSSSSSFIIIGEELEKNDYDNAMKLANDGKTILAVFENAGTSGECEDFIARVAAETDPLLRKIGKCRDARFFDTERVQQDDEEELSIGENDIGKQIFFFDNDYDSPGLASIERTVDVILDRLS